MAKVTEEINKKWKWQKMGIVNSPTVTLYEKEKTL